MGDITEGYLPEVHEVRTASVLVPLACEDARAHDMLTGDAKSTDTSKKVDKRKRRRRLLSEGWLNLGELGRHFAFAGLGNKLTLEEPGMVGFVSQRCQIVQGELIPGQCGGKVRG